MDKKIKTISQSYTRKELVEMGFDYIIKFRKAGRPRKDNSKKPLIDHDIIPKESIKMRYIPISISEIKRCFVCIKHTDPKTIILNADKNGFVIHYNGLYHCKTVYTHDIKSKNSYICTENISKIINKDQLIKIVQNIGEKCDNLRLIISSGQICNDFIVEYISNKGAMDNNTINLNDAKISEEDSDDKFDISNYPIEFKMSCKLFRQYFIDKSVVGSELEFIAKGNEGILPEIRVGTVDVHTKTSFTDENNFNIIKKMNSDDILSVTFKIEDLKILSSIVMKCDIHVYINANQMLCLITDPPSNISHYIIIKSISKQLI
jgi:hypothetical protein